MVTEKPIDAHGMTIMFVMGTGSMVDKPYVRFAVLYNKHGGFVIEKFNKDGSLSKRQPRELWDMCWDSYTPAKYTLVKHIRDTYGYERGH